MNLIIGFLTGIAASMGLGGGFILIVYLTLFTDIPQITAQGINILFFLPVALFSMILHTRSRLIEWKIIPAAAIAGVIGAAIGITLGSVTDESTLRKLFAGLLIIVALRELFHKQQQGEPTEK